MDIIDNERLVREYGAVRFFGPQGEYRRIPSPLWNQYNVRNPVIAIAKPLEGGADVACVRWFGMTKDKETNPVLTGFQYLFPILIDPVDPKLFTGRDITECQVLSIYSSRTGQNDMIEIVSYGNEKQDIVAIQAGLILRGE